MSVSIAILLIWKLMFRLVQNLITLLINTTYGSMNNLVMMSRIVLEKRILFESLAPDEIFSYLLNNCKISGYRIVGKTWSLSHFLYFTLSML